MSTQFETPDKTLQQMSADELLDLKRRWYMQADRGGDWGRVARICRELGEPLTKKNGRAHELYVGNIRIHLDPSDSSLTFIGYPTGLYVDDESGKRVCSTTPTDMLFVPGEWLSKVEMLHERARESENRLRESRKNRRTAGLRKQLLQELGR